MPYRKHPFRLYTGQRFTDMVASIAEYGIIQPVIVQAIEDEKYEILSGHNRVEGAKANGLTEVPCIIVDGLSDEEALLIVTETNFRQRSFKDLTHSERAVTLSMHHAAIKHQGRTSSIVEEIEAMLNQDNDDEDSKNVAMQQKTSARELTAQEYDLNPNAVIQYLRVNKLIQPLMARLDNNEIAMRTAVSVSYLTEAEQEMLEKMLQLSEIKLDMKKAESLKRHSREKTLTEAAMKLILNSADVSVKHQSRVSDFKVSKKIISKYFTADDSPETIENTIERALEDYTKKRGA